jgi:hypothetical protein
VNARVVDCRRGRADRGTLFRSEGRDVVWDGDGTCEFG